MYKDLYKKISKKIGLITVFLGDEKISEGSCFCFLDNGQVLTAAHVVTGRIPIKHEDIKDPNVRYFIKFPDTPVLEYVVTLCSMTICVIAFKEPIQIDIATLKPKYIYSVDYPVLVADINSVSLGEEVFLAGYSDELEIPFSVDRILKHDGNGAKEFYEAMNKGFKADMTGPLIKRAVVGNYIDIVAEQFDPKLKIVCGLMYLDNAMHSGASGGPVVNRNGDAVGIITQRAITSASQSEDASLKVPSGSTLAISLKPLLVLNQINS